MADQPNILLARRHLIEAAVDANAASELLGHVVGICKEHDPALESHLLSLRVLVQHVGWLVERANGLLGETCEVLGADAEAWLLPGLCADSAEGGRDHG